MPAVLGINFSEALQSDKSSSGWTVENANISYDLPNAHNLEVSSRLLIGSINNHHWTRSILDLLTNKHIEFCYKGIEALLKLFQLGERSQKNELTET